MKIVIIAFLLLGLLIAAYLAVGALHDLRRRYVESRLGAARRALAVVLFDADYEAARAFPTVSRLPRAWLLDVAQGVLVDLGDATHERLRHVVDASGAARRIRALARRRVWTKRIQAAQLLHLLSPDDPLRDELLGDSHPLVRARAVESLAVVEVGDRATVIIEMLAHRNRPERIAAQQALLRGDSRVVGALRDFLLLHADAGTNLALEIAANRPDPRFLEVLLEYATDDDPSRRLLVAEGLGALAFDRAAAVLTDMLCDPDAGVRAAAARAVGRMGLSSAAARLGLLLSDAAFAVRREAGLALGALGPSGAVVLRAHLFDPDRYARDMAQQVLDADATRRHMPRVMLPEALRDLGDGTNPSDVVVAT